MFLLGCFAVAINDEWRQQKETHRATFVEHVIRVRRVEKAGRAAMAAAEGIGEFYISKLPLLCLGLSASAGFSSEGRESPSLCMGTNKTRWFFFSLSVWFIVHSVSENTRRKCMCVWHKGGSKDKISELMIKREAAIRTVTLLPLKKKMKYILVRKVFAGKEKKIPPGYTTYSMCTVVLCLLPHLPQVIKYTSNRVITGPVCCL